MSAAAVIAVRRKRLVRRFREAGATHPDRAVTLATLGERRSWIFDQMVRHGVFVASSDGRYYLNDVAATAFLSRCRKRALVGLGVLLLLAFVMWIIGLMAGR